MSNVPPPPPYGAPQHGDPQYGAPPYGAPAYGMPVADYASWIQRVGSALIDAFVTLLAGIPLFIGYGLLFAGATTTTNADGTTSLDMNSSPAAVPLILLGVVLYLAVFVWNVCIKQGRTGYSVGKGMLGIRLINEASGQPIGAGMSFVRQIAHILDGFCYIGYLWPLWDGKRQTFADKVMSTVVVNQPKG